MWRVIPGRDIKGNLSGLKGVTMDNFSISVKEWWKMIISHLKHSYLNWRANPCKRKRLQYFFQKKIWIWLPWFSFGLNRIFQVHDMTINFSFCSFVLMIRLLWATTHAINGLQNWSIISHVGIVLGRVVFWFKVVHVISVQRKKYGSKVFLRNGQFLVNMP